MGIYLLTVFLFPGRTGKSRYFCNVSQLVLSKVLAVCSPLHLVSHYAFCIFVVFNN